MPWILDLLAAIAGLEGDARSHMSEGAGECEELLIYNEVVRR